MTLAFAKMQDDVGFLTRLTEEVRRLPTALNSFPYNTTNLKTPLRFGGFLDASENMRIINPSMCARVCVFAKSETLSSLLLYSSPFSKNQHGGSSGNRIPQSPF